MGDVISAYRGEHKRSYGKLISILVLILIIILVGTLFLFRPWIKDDYYQENQDFTISLENVGTVDDKLMEAKIDASGDTECDYEISGETSRNRCYRKHITDLKIIVGCDVFSPEMKINVTCSLPIGRVKLNLSLRSRYQFIMRDFICDGICTEDKSALTGPMPNFLSYASMYWGDRLIDLTEWYYRNETES